MARILEAFADRAAIEQDFHDLKEVQGAGQQQVGSQILTRPSPVTHQDDLETIPEASVVGSAEACIEAFGLGWWQLNRDHGAVPSHKSSGSPQLADGTASKVHESGSSLGAGNGSGTITGAAIVPSSSLPQHAAGGGQGGCGRLCVHRVCA